MKLQDTDRVLFIGAHPDDETLGCAGFLHRLNTMGIDTRVAIIGEGTTCRIGWTQSDIDDREHALLNACRILGTVSASIPNLTSPHYPLPCGAFNAIPLIDVNRLVEAHIKSFEPTVVITHYYDDNHRDHEVVNRSVRIATRPYIGTKIHTVLMCEILSSTDLSAFRPNVFVPLSEADVDAKVRAMQCFPTEIFESNHPRSADALRAQMRLRGCQSGNEYAEAFMMQRMELFSF